MSLFDRVKNNQEDCANAKVANPANDEAKNGSGLATLAELALATPPRVNLESPFPSPPLPVVSASDGRVLAWSTDPPHIRVYAWALQTLRFVLVDAQTSQILKILSGEMDSTRLRKLAAELRMTEREVRGGLDRLVAEGDLGFKAERGRRIYQLAPLQY